MSSVGSTTLQISLMVFMKLDGYSLLQIGAVIGGARFAALITSLALGDLADRIQPKALILWTELFSVLISAALAWAWSRGQNGFGLFICLYLLRSGVLAVQQPGRNKIAKLVSDDTYLSNSRQAIWLNKVTHGAMFFAAGISLLAIVLESFYWVIAFDAVTFLVNTWIIFRARLDTRSASTAPKKYSVTEKFKDFYRYNFRTALLDLCLAFALCGGNLFTVRMAGNNEAWIPVYLTSYGLAVWVTGYLERINYVRRLHSIIWLAFGFSFFLIGTYPGRGVLTWFLFLVNDHCYWLLFHRYSSAIQTNTPIEKMASVSSARMVQMILILASGELLVGSWQNIVPLFWEGAWRAIFCVLIALLLRTYLFKKNNIDEHTNI